MSVAATITGGNISAFNINVANVATSIKDLTTTVNNLINDKSITTEQLLGQLQSTFERQEGVSLLTNMVKAISDMNQGVTQSMK